MPKTNSSSEVRRRDEDMQRSKVNAQVTYITTILEVFGSVTFVIHVLIVKRPTLSTLIHGMCIYMIFVPYAFLMNTSHNKGRIIEDGWENVIRNIFGMKTSVSSNESLATPSKKISSADANQVDEINIEDRKEWNKNTDKDVFSTTTSYYIHKLKHTNDNGRLLNVPFNGESFKVPKVQKGKITNKHFINILDMNKFMIRKENDQTSQNLIFSMIKDIND